MVEGCLGCENEPACRVWHGRGKGEGATKFPARGGVAPMAEAGAGLGRPLLKGCLLHFVQLLINQQGEESEQKHARADAENPHRDRETIYLGQ
jgi:hypothetical protein